MKTEVGYCIYLPSEYERTEVSDRRFPVVYYLHGGRPGNETKSLGLVPFLDKQMEAGVVSPMIYVFVNGGPVSHYNLPDKPNAQGEDVFVKELIPHIDKTYRTVAKREGRGLEGFSQGGRGVLVQRELEFAVRLVSEFERASCRKFRGIVPRRFIALGPIPEP